MDKINKTPLQSFTTSRLATLVSQDIDDHNYGIDEDGPVSFSDDLDHVVIPSANLDLPPDVQDRLEEIDPLQSSLV